MSMEPSRPSGSNSKRNKNESRNRQYKKGNAAENEEEKPETILKGYSAFLNTIYRNDAVKMIMDMLEGAAINDDRQHMQGTHCDISPLYFAVNGVPGKEPNTWILRPNTKAAIVELLMTHPLLDPNQGMVKWEDRKRGASKFVRESPLLAAVERVAASKAAYRKHPGKQEREKWCGDCMITQMLCEHVDTDVECGRQQRINDDPDTPADMDDYDSPLEAVMEPACGGTPSLDVALLLVLAGGDVTDRVKGLIEKTLEKIPSAKQGKDCIHYDESNPDYEVDEHYRKIYIPPNVEWRWDMNSEDCAFRFYAYERLWSIGWRPESHKYFPVPFRKAKVTLEQCITRVTRYDVDSTETSRYYRDLDLEGDKFEMLEHRCYEFLLRGEACTKLEVAAADKSKKEVREARDLLLQYPTAESEDAHVEQRGDDGVRVLTSQQAQEFRAARRAARELICLTDERGRLLETGLGFAAPPLALQLGTPASKLAGEGVLLSADQRQITIVDAQSGLTLRAFPWAMVVGVEADVEGAFAKVKMEVLCGGDRDRSHGARRPHLQAVGLPPEQCGCWKLYCPGLVEAMRLHLQLQRDAASEQGEEDDGRGDDNGGGGDDGGDVRRDSHNSTSSSFSSASTKSSLSSASSAGDGDEAAAALKKERLLARKPLPHPLSLLDGADLLDHVVVESNEKWLKAMDLRLRQLRAELSEKQEELKKVKSQDKALRQLSSEKQMEMMYDSAKKTTNVDFKHLLEDIQKLNFLIRKEVQRRHIYDFRVKSRTEEQKEEDDRSEEFLEMDAISAEAEGRLEDARQLREKARKETLSQFADLREEAINLTKGLWKTGFAPIMSELDLVQERLEGMADREIKPKRQVRIAEKAVATQEQMDDQIRLFFGLGFSKYLEKTKYFAKAAEKAGRTEEANAQWEKFRAMTVQFWHQVFHTGREGDFKNGSASGKSIPSFYFVKLLYTLYFKDAIRTSQRQLQQALDDLETLPQRALKAREETNKAREMMAEAQAAMRAAKGEGNGDEDEEDNGEEEGEEDEEAVEEAQKLVDAAQAAEAKAEALTPTQSEAELRARIEEMRVSSLKELSIFWKEAFSQQCAEAIRDIRRAENQAEHARAVSEPKSKRRRELERAEGARKHALHMDAHAKELHTTLYAGRVLSFWHIGFRHRMHDARGKVNALSKKLAKLRNGEEEANDADEDEDENDVAAASAAKVQRVEDKLTEWLQELMRLGKAFWTNAMFPVVVKPRMEQIRTLHDSSTPQNKVVHTQMADEVHADLQEICLVFLYKTLGGYVKRLLQQQDQTDAEERERVAGLDIHERVHERRHLHQSWHQGGRQPHLVKAWEAVRQLVDDGKEKGDYSVVDVLAMKKVRDLERQAGEARRQVEQQMLTLEKLQAEPRFDYVPPELPIADAAQSRIEQLRAEGQEVQATRAEERARECARSHGHSRLVKTFKLRLKAQLKEASKDLALRVAEFTKMEKKRDKLKEKHARCVSDIEGVKRKAQERGDKAVRGAQTELAEMEIKVRDLKALTKDDGAAAREAGEAKQAVQAAELALGKARKAREAEKRKQKEDAAAEKAAREGQEGESADAGAEEAEEGGPELYAAAEVEAEAEQDDADGLIALRAELAAVKKAVDCAAVADAALSSLIADLERAEAKLKKAGGEDGDKPAVQQAEEKRKKLLERAKMASVKAAEDAEKLAQEVKEHAQAMADYESGVKFWEGKVADFQEGLEQLGHIEFMIEDKRKTCSARIASALELSRRALECVAAGETTALMSKSLKEERSSERTQAAAAAKASGGNGKILSNPYRSPYESRLEDMTVDIPKPPKLAGNGLFYTYDNRTAKYYLEAKREKKETERKWREERERDKGGDAAVSSEHEHEQEQEEEDPDFPISVVAYSAQHPVVGAWGRACEPATAPHMLPPEVEVCAGPTGVVVKKRRPEKPPASSDPIDSTAPASDAITTSGAEGGAAEDEDRVLYRWPWCVLSKLSTLEVDDDAGKTYLEVHVGGRQPAQVDAVNVMGLPDTIRVKWTSGFQGSPCQLDRANVIHSLPVTEYMVERDGGVRPDGGDWPYQSWEEAEAESALAARYTAANTDTWRGIEDFRWGEQGRSSDGGASGVSGAAKSLHEGVQYRFRVRAKNAIGWGEPSEWSAPVGLMQQLNLELEKCWEGGLRLPQQALARVLSFLPFDGFPSNEQEGVSHDSKYNSKLLAKFKTLRPPMSNPKASTSTALVAHSDGNGSDGKSRRGPPYVIHSNGRTVQRSELSRFLRKMAFLRLKENYMAQGGAARSRLIHLAVKQVRYQELAVATLEAGKSLKLELATHKSWLPRVRIGSRSEEHADGSHMRTVGTAVMIAASFGSHTLQPLQPASVHMYQTAANKSWGRARKICGMTDDQDQKKSRGGYAGAFRRAMGAEKMGDLLSKSSRTPTTKVEFREAALVPVVPRVDMRARRRASTGGQQQPGRWAMLQAESTAAHNCSSSSGGGGSDGAVRGPEDDDKNFFEVTLGQEFFCNPGGGQWSGFEKPTMSQRLGSTLFVRIHPQTESAVMCGREPLHLTHDDELWAPVILRGIHPDGRVDYETEYDDGSGKGWKLRMPAWTTAYDPMKKLEIYMPKLFTAKQLEIWRNKRWQRTQASQRIRLRNLAATYRPGEFVKVGCGGAWVEGGGTLAADASWEGMVMAVNRDGTYSVSGERVHQHSVSENSMTKLDYTDTNKMPSHFRERLASIDSGELPDFMQPLAPYKIRNRSPAYSPLHYACAECSTTVVKEMLENTEIDYFSLLNHPDGCLNTPLHWAASAGRLETVKLLLENKARTDVQNYMSLTPVQWAEKRNKSSILHELEKRKWQRQQNKKTRGKQLAAALSVASSASHAENVKVQQKRLLQLMEEGGTAMGEVQEGEAADKICPHLVIATIKLLRKEQSNSALEEHMALSPRRQALGKWSDRVTEAQRLYSLDYAGVGLSIDMDTGKSTTPGKATLADRNRNCGSTIKAAIALKKLFDTPGQQAKPGSKNAAHFRKPHPSGRGRQRENEYSSDLFAEPHADAKPATAGKFENN